MVWTNQLQGIEQTKSVVAEPSEYFWNLQTLLWVPANHFINLVILKYLCAGKF